MRVKINEEDYIKYAINWWKQVSNLCIDVFEVIVLHGELVKVGKDMSHVLFIVLLVLQQPPWEMLYRYTYGTPHVYSSINLLFNFSKGWSGQLRN